jgi:hypothetical protein
MKFKLEFDNLEQIIKEKCKSKKVIYFPNQPGNWGDGELHQTIRTRGWWEEDKEITDSELKY